MMSLERQEAFEALLESMGPYLEEMAVESGEYVIRQGTAAPGLYFVVSGAVTSLLEQEGEEAVRLRTMGAGSVVGEMGLYIPTTLYSLRHSSFYDPGNCHETLKGLFL